MEAQARKMTRDDQAVGPEEEGSSQVAVRVGRKSWFEKNSGTAACNSGQTRKETKNWKVIKTWEEVRLERTMEGSQKQLCP